REVPHAAAADEHHRVLLQVVADARDVGGHLHAVDETHAAHLAQSRVRLLRRGRVHAGAHAALLRVALERGGLLLLDRLLATLADQLVNGSQSFSPSTSCVFGVFVCAQLMRTQKQASSKDANENSTIRTWRCQTPHIRAYLS